jgi:hypothetical protein
VSHYEKENRVLFWLPFGILKILCVMKDNCKKEKEYSGHSIGNNGSKLEEKLVETQPLNPKYIHRHKNLSVVDVY